MTSSTVRFREAFPQAREAGFQWRSAPLLFFRPSSDKKNASNRWRFRA
jgi:hypothetical protein